MSDPKIKRGDVLYRVRYNGEDRTIDAVTVTRINRDSVSCYHAASDKPWSPVDFDAIDSGRGWHTSKALAIEAAIDRCDLVIANHLRENKRLRAERAALRKMLREVSRG